VLARVHRRAAKRSDLCRRDGEVLLGDARYTSASDSTLGLALLGAGVCGVAFPATGMSAVRRNSASTFSQRITLHHWFKSSGRSRYDSIQRETCGDDGLAGGRWRGAPRALRATDRHPRGLPGEALDVVRPSSFSSDSGISSGE